MLLPVAATFDVCSSLGSPVQCACALAGGVCELPHPVVTDLLVLQAGSNALTLVPDRKLGKVGDLWHDVQGSSSITVSGHVVGLQARVQREVGFVPVTATGSELWCASCHIQSYESFAGQQGKRLHP